MKVRLLRCATTRPLGGRLRAGRPDLRLLRAHDAGERVEA